MTITAADLVVPYITAREGEEADSLLNLNVRIGPDRRPRLGYKDEAGPDRDLRGVLWARYSMSLGFAGQPTGNPRWRLVHPLRQRITMALLRCQVCTVPLKRSDGILFVETADDGDDYTGPVKTAQPPVCLEHARMAARRCPRLRSQGHVALLATRFPLYGVIGTPYQYTADGIQPLAASDAPCPTPTPRSAGSSPLSSYANCGTTRSSAWTILCPPHRRLLDGPGQRTGPSSSTPELPGLTIGPGWPEPEPMAQPRRYAMVLSALASTTCPTHQRITWSCYDATRHQEHHPGPGADGRMASRTGST